MAQTHNPNTESCSTTASNTATVPQPRQDAQVLAAQPLQGKYILSHGVRLSVVITSACLAVCGLLFIVLGAIGSCSGFLQGLGGLNAAVTGVLLLLTGGLGCLTFIKSKARSVGRILLICVVVMCHTSGAFAIQCSIISGQLVVRYQAESCDVITASGTGINSSAVPYCPQDTSLVIAACILTLAILGFILGVACSASCYFAAPRLLCCLFDMRASPKAVDKRYNQPTGVESRASLAEEQVLTNV